jgi:hypothetical protein
MIASLIWAIFAVIAAASAGWSISRGFIVVGVLYLISAVLSIVNAWTSLAALVR